MSIAGIPVGHRCRCGLTRGWVVRSYPRVLPPRQAVRDASIWALREEIQAFVPNSGAGPERPSSGARIGGGPAATGSVVSVSEEIAGHVQFGKVRRVCPSASLRTKFDTVSLPLCIFKRRPRALESARARARRYGATAAALFLLANSWASPSWRWRPNSSESGGRNFPGRYQAGRHPGPRRRPLLGYPIPAADWANESAGSSPGA
jgi:hypothetical protein